MNKILSVFIILLAMAFSACEKDDICVEGDTALLVITFYDAENPMMPKPAADLRIVGAGQTTTIGTFTDRTAIDSVGIPLNPSERITEFLFITDSSDDEDGFEAGNIDGLDFSYEVQEKFIGRACGFIANYDNLNAAITPDTENWIQSIEIVKALVQTEDTLSTHVKIFH